MDLDEYQCTLDPVYVEKAKKELNENPEDRTAACKAFYDWIKQQPHLNLPGIDTFFLLTFLRGAKWSQLGARQKLEGWLRLKVSVPEWFENIDPGDPKVQMLIDTGFVLKLPKRDKNGCQILIIRQSQIDPSSKVYTHDDVIKTIMVVGALMSFSEVTQICGGIFMNDLTGITSKHMTGMLNRKDMERFKHFFHGNAPGRQKGIYYYNAGAFFDTLLAFIKPFMPKKYQERIKTFDSAESLYKEIPMELLPVEYLPDDYTGPNAGTIQDIVDNLKNEFADENLRKLLKVRSSREFGLDESKKPEGEVAASFRKLNVD